MRKYGMAMIVFAATWILWEHVYSPDGPDVRGRRPVVRLQPIQRYPSRRGWSQQPHRVFN